MFTIKPNQPHYYVSTPGSMMQKRTVMFLPAILQDLSLKRSLAAIWFAPAFDGHWLKSAQSNRIELKFRPRLNWILGEKLATPGESGIGSLELANAVTLSSDEGRWVNLPISRPKYDALLSRLQRKSTFVKKEVKVQRKTDPKLGA